jgi:hypothetical protein
MSMESGKEEDAGLAPQAAVYRWNRLLSKLPGVDLRRYVFVEQPIGHLPQASPQFPSLLFEQDDPQLAKLWPNSAVRKYRFAQGARCLVVLHKDRLAGGLWLIDRRYVEDEVRATYIFADSHSWDFGLYIDPDFRATRAFAALWGAAALHLATEGKRGSLSRIADYLAPSLRAHARMGAKYLGRATFLTLGKAQYCWPSAELLHCNLSTGAQFNFGSGSQ